MNHFGVTSKIVQAVEPSATVALKRTFASMFPAPFSDPRSYREEIGTASIFSYKIPRERIQGQMSISPDMPREVFTLSEAEIARWIISAVKYLLP